LLLAGLELHRYLTSSFREQVAVQRARDVPAQLRHEFVHLPAQNGSLASIDADGNRAPRVLKVVHVAPLRGHRQAAGLLLQVEIGHARAPRALPADDGDVVLLAGHLHTELDGSDGALLADDMVEWLRLLRGLDPDFGDIRAPAKLSGGEPECIYCHDDLPIRHTNKPDYRTWVLGHPRGRALVRSIGRGQGTGNRYRRRVLATVRQPSVDPAACSCIMASTPFTVRCSLPALLQYTTSYRAHLAPTGSARPPGGYHASIRPVRPAPRESAGR